MSGLRAMATHPTGTKYQVGRPADLRDDDPWFTKIEDAIEHANKMHNRFMKHTLVKDTVAIWDERNAYVYLFFDGEMFKWV